MRRKQGEKISLDLVLGLSLSFLLECQWIPVPQKEGVTVHERISSLLLAFWALDSI